MSSFTVKPLDKKKKDVVVDLDKFDVTMAYVIRLKATHKESGKTMYLGQGLQGSFWTSNRLMSATFPSKPLAELEFQRIGLETSFAEIIDTEWRIG